MKRVKILLRHFSSEQSRMMIILFLFCTHLLQAQSFRNATLSDSERAHSLLQELTADEKISWLMNANPPLNRLGLPGYNWWNEALHGVARQGKATVFPQAINLAATFDTTLVERIGKTIGIEARAKWNESRLLNKTTQQYKGLTFWSPNVNIFRDPRWGRGQETYGEDPWLTARIGVNFVKGLQYRENGRPLAAACAKHFAVHSGPEKNRHSFNALPSLQDLNETYLPAFRSLVVEAKVKGVMCAYNRLYNKPCCGSDSLLRHILKKEWNFQGYTVTDCGAIYDMHSFHKTHSTIEEAAITSLQAGVNLECGSAFQYLSNAYYSGKIFNSDLDSALFPLLRLKFELGILDEPGGHAFDSLSAYHIHHPSHRMLALEAAEKSLVLLENKKNTLPLSLTTSSIALVGPLVFEPFVLLGNYHGWSPEMNTVLEGVLQAAPSTVNIAYEQAFSLYSTPTERTFDYKKLASHDALIVTLGINSLFQGEAGDAFLSDAGGDLGKLTLPPNQIQFLRELRSNYSGKIIVLLFSGGPLITTAIEPYCDALLWCGYPGEQGGSAIGRALFGRFSPSGKLPVTFPEREEHLPDFDNYSMANRTYRYTNFIPEYSFGYGLSYLEFEMNELTLVTKEENEKFPTQVELSLTNRSKRAGEEVLQFYLHPVSVDQTEANYTLVHFERVHLNENETKLHTVQLPKQAYLSTNTEGKQVALKGKYELIVSTKGPFAKESLRLLVTL